MEKKINASKGHKGFYKQYPNLGKKVIIRVPKLFIKTLEEILPLCDSALAKNEEEYYKIMEMFKKVLNNIKPVSVNELEK